MEFYLTYQGPLKSNGNTTHKHAIREYFKPQIQKLWKIPPLDSHTDYLDISSKKDCKNNIIKEVSGIYFAPLITSKLSLLCQLDILLLWPEEPGKIIGNGGDIDNRLKTLFDALACPTPEQIEKLKKNRTSFDKPYFCLLEDDKLITSINIKTHTKLYSEGPDSSDVHTVLHVKINAKTLSWGNIGISA